MDAHGSGATARPVRLLTTLSFLRKTKVSRDSVNLKRASNDQRSDYPRMVLGRSRGRKDSEMPKRLNVTVSQPGGGDGTRTSPFKTGSVFVQLPHNTPDGPVNHPDIVTEILDHDPCPDPRLAPKFTWLKREGHAPVCELPVVHNTKDDPASFKITVKVKVKGANFFKFDYEYSNVFHFYTESCPLHRTGEEQDKLNREMWRRRKATLGMAYWTVVCEDGHRKSVDKVYLKIMEEMNPGRFKKGLMTSTFSGTKSELLRALAAAEVMLHDKTTEAEEIPPGDAETIYFEKQNVLLALRNAKREIRKIEVALENEGIS